MPLYKDEILDALAASGNVAQFISYRPDANGEMAQTYSRVAGYVANHKFSNIAEGISTLLGSSAIHQVNVRSYIPYDPQSREFVYGLSSVAEALKTIERLASQGLF